VTFPVHQINVANFKALNTASCHAPLGSAHHYLPKSIVLCREDSRIALLEQMGFVGEALDALLGLMHRNAHGNITGLEDGQAGIGRDEAGDAVTVRQYETQATGMHQMVLRITRRGLGPLKCLPVLNPLRRALRPNRCFTGQCADHRGALAELCVPMS